MPQRNGFWLRRVAHALTAMMAVTLGAIVSAAPAANAQDVCPGYYVTVFQSNVFSQKTGSGTANYNPGEIQMNTRDTNNNYVSFAGVTRPRRAATFKFIDESGTQIFSYTTEAAKDNGVIEQERSSHWWDTIHQNRPGQKIYVYADFRHRCGGDDVPANNVYVGNIVTYPSVPVDMNPKYLVLSVLYSPPGRGSSVDYGNSTTVGGRFSFSNSFTGGVTVTNINQVDVRRTLTNTTSFTQRATFGFSDAVEKSETGNVIVPGPTAAIETVPHDFDLFEVWLNPRLTVRSTSRTSVETSGYTVDTRDPVPGMDIVRLSVAELKNPALLAPGTASRLQRSWSPSGALNTADFNAILAHNPFANGGTAIDPARYTLMNNANFDFRPADPGGQPVTERIGVRMSATAGSSQAFTTTVSNSFTVETTAPQNPVILELEEKLNTTHRVNRTAEVSYSFNLDQTNTGAQSTNVSIVGPGTGYQGPTALRMYQDNRFGTVMFAFAEVATFQVGTTTPDRTATQGGAAQFALTTQRDFGFNGPVSFSSNVTGLPPGASVSFSPSTVDAGNGSTMTVATSPQTPPGTYALTLSATSGLIRRNLTVNLTVNPLPFTVTLTPATRTVSSGQTTSYTVKVTAAPDFSGPVQLLGPGGLPPGATATVNPSTINGSGEATLTVTTAPNTPSGTRNLSIIATGGGISPTVTATLVVDNVQDFGLTVTPQAAGVSAGETALYTVTTNAINGFNGLVNLSVSGHPAGPAPSFSVNPIVGAGSSTLSIPTTAATATGDYVLTVTGTSGGLTRSRSVILTVSPPQATFTLAATPSTRSATAGSGTTYTVSTNPVGGFTGGIAMSVSGLPSGVTGSFTNTAPVAPGSPATLSVGVGGAVTPGSYQLTITGASGSIVRTQNVTLTVTVPSPPPPGVFGYDRIGASVDSSNLNYMNGSRYVTGPNGLNVSTIKVYMTTVQAAPNNQYQVAIYTDVNGRPGTRVAASASGTLTANSWNARPVSATLAPDTAYWLFYNTNGDNNISFDSGGEGDAAWGDGGQQFGTWPSTFGQPVMWNVHISIYAQ